MQVADQARALAKNTKLNIFTITGGVQYQEHADILATTQDIVVATPGRLREYIDAERFDCRAIEWLVLDEADRMLDMGFAPTVDRLSNECRWRKQTLLFSATLEGKGVEGFTADLLNEPAEIDAKSPLREQRLPELDDDSRRFWCMDNEAKAAAFGELYCSPSSGQDAATPSSLLYVSAATGIGSGLVVQGTPPRVIRGVHGLAGEIGHTLLAPGGKPCHCGNHGCAETLVSGWALRDALGIEAGASLSEGVEHHRDPDLVAETLNQAGEALGLLLLNLHLTLNPERIVIGGSLVKLGAPLLDPALAFFTRHQNHLLPQAPPIPVRILDDSLATAARGAAAQVLCQLLARHDEFATDE